MKNIAAFVVAGIGVVVAGWTLASSYAFVYLFIPSGSRGGLEWPWCAWLTYAMDEDTDAVVWQRLRVSGLAGAAAICLVAILLAVLYFRSPPSGRQRRRWFKSNRSVERAVTNNHGRARWMTMEEAKDIWPGPHRDHGGIVIGEAYRVDEDIKDVRFKPHDKSTWGKGGKAPLLIDPCTEGPGHCIMIAGSGFFKSTTAVSTLLHWTGASVVLDVKAELGGMVRDHIESEHGKKVHLLNPVRPDDAEEWGFNALDWIDPASATPEEDIYTVVSWIFDANREKEDPFFDPWARSLIACLLADMIWDEEPIAPKTLATLRRGITRPEPDMKNLLRGIYHHSPSHFAHEIAGSIMDAPDKQFGGIYGTAVKGTAWLSVPTLADLVSGNAFKTKDIIDGSVSVFAQIPIDTMDHSPGVARVIIGALVKAMIRANGNVNGKVLFLLDEAFRLKHMPVIEQVRDMGRSAGLVLFLIYQTVGQLNEQWGRTGKAKWYGTVSWRGYAAVRDHETADELSKECGQYGVMATSEGENAGSQGNIAAIVKTSKSTGRNTNTHEQHRPVAFAHEFTQEPRTDELFVVGTGFRPLRCGRAIYFRRAEMVEKVNVETTLARVA